MRTRMMMLAALGLSLAACATETTYEGTIIPGPTVAKSVCRTGCSGLDGSIGNRDWIAFGEGVYQSAPTTVPGADANAVPDLCAQLPESGTCSLACDPAGFASTLPTGTCGAAQCSVAGGEILVSACNAAN